MFSISIFSSFRLMTSNLRSGISSFSLQNISIVLVLGISITAAVVLIFEPQTWLRAYNSGAKVKFTELIALHIRNVPTGLIIDTRIELFKSGIDITVGELARHYLSGGDVNMVVEGLLKAQKKRLI